MVINQGVIAEDINHVLKMFFSLNLLFEAHIVDGTCQRKNSVWAEIWQQLLIEQWAPGANAARVKSFYNL